AATPDPANLPIGDGKLSSAPEVGKVWSCTTEFGGGGAFKDGPWIRGDGTFDFTAKAVVDGAVEWPSQLTITLAGAVRTVTGNDLPRHATGTYPVSPQDDAYQYDRNPNRIAAQTVSWSLPAVPEEAASASCVGLGPVGVMLTGAYVFNGLDALGRDAVAHEIQDSCQGHPERNGSYHYHSLSLCAEDAGDGHSALVGYALDGFGIFGRRGEDGRELASADLDACHGHSHEVDWDGQRRVMFHYHATLDYPYTVGCYRGTPIRAGGGGGRPPRP
ncbi:MAG TPA: YHYH protein, partial [Anaerolineae bacterium]|nr:YHYH protein [Anaerolineae bacterium]